MILKEISNYKPTGHESEDVFKLYDLTGKIDDESFTIEVKTELIKIFEKYPNYDFGAPGPIVHKLEESTTEDLVTLVCESFSRKPTHMVFWMIDRCLRSFESKEITILVKVLEESLDKTESIELKKEINETIKKYT